MKIILTFYIKNTSTETAALKQAMDELNEIYNFSLLEQLSAHAFILPCILLQLFRVQFFPNLKTIA